MPATAKYAVNLRVRGDIRNLIDHAARAQSKSRTEFIVEASRRAAEEALLDQTLVRVDSKTFAEFTRLLDAPPENPGYRRLMARKPPWAK
jgi:uncharacterized protein (DUF1778 family)